MGIFNKNKHQQDGDCPAAGGFRGATSYSDDQDWKLRYFGWKGFSLPAGADKQRLVKQI